MDHLTNTSVSARGQGLVEYALILVLVAIAVIVALALFGTSLGDTYNRIIAELPF